MRSYNSSSSSSSFSMKPVCRRVPWFLPYGDVENVGADRTGHRHVSETFPGYDDTGDEIRDGGSSCQDGQPHDLLCDADGLTNLHRMKRER